MREKYFACKTSDVAIGKQKIVKLKKIPIGIFKTDENEYRALINICPHKRAALCEGPQTGTTCHTDNGEVAFDYVDENRLVRCAWHGWEFSLDTGVCRGDPKFRARTFEVEVDQDDVFVYV